MGLYRKDLMTIPALLCNLGEKPSKMLGAVAKPLSGVATLASKTSEGMASDARRYIVMGDKSKEWLQMRVRQPRAMGANNTLLPYPRTPLIMVAQGVMGRTQHALTLLPSREGDEPGTEHPQVESRERRT